jgi:methanogenic corrinoid protein MtbC1
MEATMLRMKLGARFFAAAMALGAVAGVGGTARADQACEDQCKKDWPREYLHAVQRKGCIAKCWAADKARAAAEKAKAAAEAVKETAAKAYEGAKETASRAVEAVKSTGEKAIEKAKSAYEAGKAAVKKTYEAGKAAVKKAYEGGKAWAKDKYEKGKAWAKDKYEKGKAWVKDKYEKGKAWVKEKYEKGKAWVKDKYEKGKAWVRGTWAKGAAWAKGALQKGQSYVKEQVKEAWQALKDLDCGKLVEISSKLDPMSVLLQQVPILGRCGVEARKGFICSIPDTVKELGKVVVGSAKAAWDNKGKCITAGLATTAMMVPGAGTAMCGLYYYAVPKLKKLGQCVQQLYNAKDFWAELKTMFKKEGTSKSMRDTFIAAACNFIGALALDVVLTVATEGGSLPATVSKWVAWALPMGTKIPKLGAGVKLAKAVQVRRYGNLAKTILQHAPSCQ